MNFDEMNSFFSTHEMGNRDIKFRIRKRALETKERRILGTISGIYGFDAFFFFIASLGAFTENSLSRTAIIGLVSFCLVVASILGYLIFRMWRNPPPSRIFLLVPGIVLAVCGLPTLNILFFINGIALGAIYFLDKTWKDLAALSANPPEILS